VTRLVNILFSTNNISLYFDVLLTVHLSIILGTDQLNAQILVLHCCARNM